MLDLTRSRSDWAWKPKYVDIGKVVTVKKNTTGKSKTCGCVYLMYQFLSSSIVCFRCFSWPAAQFAFPSCSFYKKYNYHSLMSLSNKISITMNVWDSIRQGNLLPARRSRPGGTTQRYATKKWTQKHKVWHNINSWESKVIWIRLLQKRQPNITHLCNRDISNESKWAAKSESVFSKLIPFKNFHVWWILLVSQIRLLDLHQTDL